VRALVTGASGFVGHALAKKLAARGDTVRVLVRDRAKLARRSLAVDDVVQGDITDPRTLDRATRDVDVVYAVAGTFREPSLPDRRYRDVNIDAVRILFAAAAEHGVRRVVHCGTCGIHGSIVGPPADESHPIRPVGIYEETKAAGERLAFECARVTGVEVTTLRPGPVYGPGDTRLLKLFKLANRNPAVLVGSGTVRYHLLYIDDLTDAFLLAGTASNVANEAFLIAGPDMPCLNELFEALAALGGRNGQRVVRLPAKPVELMAALCESACRPLGISPPLYRRRIEFFLNDRAYNIDKARRLLGFEPRISMLDGLRRTAEWYRLEGLL
jgi:nucleoside-diphosphate-sugar epimerase